MIFQIRMQVLLELDKEVTRYAEEHCPQINQDRVHSAELIDVESHVMSRVDLHPSKIHNQVPFFGCKKKEKIDPAARYQVYTFTSCLMCPRASNVFPENSRSEQFCI